MVLLAAPVSASEDVFQYTDSTIGAGAYFVVLRDAPAATYRGDTAGYVATQVQRASATRDSSAVRKLDVSTAAVVAYAKFLEAQSASVAATADIAADDVLYTYNYVIAGLAVRVTFAAQLAALRRDRRVANVQRAKWMHATTFTTPGFLGLEGNSSSSGSSSGGAWDEVGGAGKAGEDVSICVIDSGIEPEHPSFSDKQNASSDTGPFAYSVSNSALYKGSCPVGEEFPAGTCK
jgi:subtilisin family serine protease